MSSFTRPVVLLALLGCAACASAPAPGSGSASAGATAPARSRGSSSLITREEVQASQGRNAYEVVEFLRPAWLRKRGGAVGVENDGAVVVYMDDTRLGPTDALRQIEKTAIASIRFLDPVSAQARYGLNHSYGAIQVVSDRS